MYQKKLTKSETAAQLSVGLLFLIGLMTTGCVEVVDDKKAEEAAPAILSQSQSVREYDGWIEKTVNYRYRGLEGVPFAYCWQNASGHRAQVDSAGVKIEIQNKDLPRETCDLLVTSGSKVRIAGGPIVEIPMDKVFSRDEALASATSEIEIETSGRIFVQSATLSTKGRSLKMSASEIHFEHALLQNFVFEGEAAKEKAGASGGNILIRAQKISGRLMIDLRGQKGGRGPKGADSRDLRLPGDVGRAGMSGGASGDVTFDVVDSSDLQVQMTFTPGDGGQGGDEGNPIMIPSATCMTELCTAPEYKPDPKRAGPQGSRGQSGRCFELNPQSPRLCPQ